MPIPDWVIVIALSVVPFKPLCWIVHLPVRLGGLASAATLESAAIAIKTMAEYIERLNPVSLKKRICWY
jgi:hypothetical protein